MKQERWIEVAEQLKKNGSSWTTISDDLYRAIGERHSNGKIRGALRRRGVKAVEPEIDLNTSMISYLSKERTEKELCQKFNVSPRVLLATIEDIKDDGYLITEIDGKFKLCKDVIPQENIHEEHWSGDRIIRFGATADSHLGSLWQQLTHLNTIYDIYEREGIKIVYHAGDITEGVNMRKGHEYEVFVHGADAQTEYAIKYYPKREGIITKFITGNHDHSSIKHAGHDIGIRIEHEREDMIYLGMANAKIELTPNCTLELNHALDGTAYALSYAIQKRIEAMSGGEKPNILIDGHHHKMLQIFYRNIHAFEAGTTQSQTAWMRGKRLPAHIGAWIIEAHVTDEGTISRCKAEWIPFYRAIENDY